MMLLKAKSKFSKECNRLRKLISKGMEHSLWMKVDDCAHAIGMSAGTLEEHTGNRVKDKNLIQKTGDKVEEYLRQKGVLKTPPMPGKKRDRAGPTPQEKPDQSGEVMERLMQLLGELAAKTSTSPDGVIISPLFDRILSGALDCTGQDHGNIRFVLRAGTFRTFDGTITDEEMSDTQQLITELRRRLTIFSQLSREKHSGQRQKLFQALSPEIDHLYIAIRQCQQVVPTDAAKHLDELSQAHQLGKRLFKTP